MSVLDLASKWKATIVLITEIWCNDSKESIEVLLDDLKVQAILNVREYSKGSGTGILAHKKDKLVCKTLDARTFEGQSLQL